MTNRTRKYLRDALDAAEQIRSIGEGLTFDAFMADSLRRPATLWNLTVIGEAMRRLQEHAPDVATRITGHRQIIRFRNHIVHQ